MNNNIDYCIYLDNASATKLSETAFNAMLPYLTTYYGNPSSRHEFGNLANTAIQESRRRVASLLSCHENEIIFTSGGTESANLAIIGTALSSNKMSIITSKIEHPAVLNTCHMLERFGYSISYIGVNKSGQVDVEEIKRSINSDTALIAIMYANNVTGIIQPVKSISMIAKSVGVPFFCDATQAVGQLDIDLSSIDIDLFGFSGHKFGAPKGTGVLIHRNNAILMPIINGGGQEFSLRSGTENVAGIVGLSTALFERKAYIPLIDNIKTIRDELLKRILTIPFTHVIGDVLMALPNFICVCFEYVNGNDIVDFLSKNNIYISSSSACSSHIEKPSYVLEAMNVPYEVARGAIRISLSKDISLDDVERVFSLLSLCVNKLRKHNPNYMRGATNC